MLWLGYIIYLGGLIVGVFSFVWDGLVWLKVLLLVIWLFLGGIILGKRSKKAFEKMGEKAEATKKKIEAAKKKIAKAEIEKNEDVKVVAKSLDINSGFASHYISFEFFDGIRKNFRVDVNEYNKIIENETGTLTYKEIMNRLIFINFQRHT
ncbi:MAG: DUF2500 domain-containing protein [Oscillospiraceae bacterium]|nr:DUF2500 domain-containing protein [Oscillospiraceae bacterium]